MNRKTFRLQQDLKRRLELHEQLQYHATHDIITGLLNRPAFTERLSTQLTASGTNQTTLVVIRISNIESITSVFGYLNKVFNMRPTSALAYLLQSLIHHCMMKKLSN